MGYTTVLDTNDIDAAVARVTEALKGEGFGVLTTIDVEATLRAKLGVEFGPYRILGACNPKLAHAALTHAPALGLLLPCNVTVRTVPGGTEISIIKPTEMFQTLDDPGLAKVAHDADVSLSRVVEALK
ncbi:MAG: hypothetical protein CVU56_15020 [Deltaproteobacteria bacterium HGW-Deltaproteobacteria-14]|nr:MAG: hypothetical protein CVU56_15020 [Deltaproteobacteria bacterium HGW-Deltaproteobacteria-14]